MNETKIDLFFQSKYLKCNFYQHYGSSTIRNRESWSILHENNPLDDLDRSFIIMIIERDDYYDIVLCNQAKSIKAYKHDNWYNYIISHLVERKLKK